MRFCSRFPRVLLVSRSFFFAFFAQISGKWRGVNLRKFTTFRNIPEHCSRFSACVASRAKIAPCRMPLYAPRRRRDLRFCPLASPTRRTKPRLKNALAACYAEPLKRAAYMTNAMVLNEAACSSCSSSAITEVDPRRDGIGFADKRRTARCYEGLTNGLKRGFWSPSMEIYLLLAAIILRAQSRIRRRAFSFPRWRCMGNFWQDIIGRASEDMTWVPAAALAVLIVILVVVSLRIAKEYERAVIFRLGRLAGRRGPGLYLLFPFIERQIIIDQRVVTAAVEQQVAISRDNVPVKVDAVVWYWIIDPAKSVVRVSEHSYGCHPNLAHDASQYYWPLHAGRRAEGER